MPAQLRDLTDTQWAILDQLIPEPERRKDGRDEARNTVVRALAFKWIRILFRCWKDHKPYSEEVYRQALARRQRCASNSSPVQLQWKNCAGFSKITAITS